MRLMILAAAAAAAALSCSAMAADPQPEIKRDAAKPQATNAVHTLRQIPEACARLEGAFTGAAATPYKFAVVRTSPKCQPRARFVDAAKARPSTATGWIFNDRISVPSAACPTQMAVVRVWRKPAGVAPPKADGQGQSRIYLEDSRKQAEANKLAAIPMYAAALSFEGVPCAK